MIDNINIHIANVCKSMSNFVYIFCNQIVSKWGITSETLYYGYMEWKGGLQIFEKKKRPNICSAEFWAFRDMNIFLPNLW